MTHLTKFTLALLSTVATSTVAMAAGTGQGGRDVLHVPMAWCALQGSPAASIPNVNGDTTTDSVLWRRHERPTDNIFLPQADITLRSAILNAWGTLNFPIIADADMTTALQGDVRGEASGVLSGGSEFANTIINCDNAWSNLGYAGIGITAINVNLFHDAAGNYGTVPAGGGFQGFPIGWAGCTKVITTNICTTPYDGRVMVADNTYFHPSVPVRTLPPTPNVPAGNIQYLTDPFDILVGHETGHSLGLPHNNSASTNLMFPSIGDNNGDGAADNINLNATEVSILRSSSMNVPGLEIDPPNQIDPGNFVGMTVVNIGNNPKLKLKPHQRLNAVNAIFDKKKNEVHVNVRLRGVNPRGVKGLRVFAAMNTADGGALDAGKVQDAINFPKQVTRDGSFNSFFDISVRGDTATGEGWLLKNGKLNKFTGAQFSLRRLTMYPVYGTIKGQSPSLERPNSPREVYDTITITLPAKELGIELDKEFLVTAGVTPDLERFDVLQTRKDKVVMLLQDPSFPHCFAQEAGEPGGTAKIRIDGLLPSRPIHALFGPTEVFKGKTDRRGEALIDLPIPNGATAGLHLVTVGIDDTALTADCVVDVKTDGKDAPRLTPGLRDKLSSKFRMLENQGRLIEQLGRILEKRKEGGLPDDDVRELIDMIKQHSKMVDQLLASPNK